MLLCSHNKLDINRRFCPKGKQKCSPKNSERQNMTLLLLTLLLWGTRTKVSKTKSCITCFWINTFISSIVAMMWSILMMRRCQIRKPSLGNTVLLSADAHCSGWRQLEQQQGNQRREKSWITPNVDPKALISELLLLKLSFSLGTCFLSHFIKKRKSSVTIFGNVPSSSEDWKQTKCSQPHVLRPLHLL